MESTRIAQMIKEGKLKTYYFGTSFIEVFWEHPRLEKGFYYRFRFTAMKEDFIDVIVESPKGLYIKRNAKVMGKHAEELVRGLVE